MKRLTPVLVLVVAALSASCASDSSFRANSEAAKQCSDTPQKAVSIFLQGIEESNIALLDSVTLDGSSLYGIFGNNDKRQGREVIRQISANPEVVEEGGSCTCSLLYMIDTPDTNVKIAAVKRIVIVSDDLRDYKRPFRVRLSNGNCILQVDPIDQKWERY